MLSEVIEWLKPEAGKNYIDGTLGGAGYTKKILELCYPGKVLAIDADPMAINNAKSQLDNKQQEHLILVNDNFKNLSRIMQTEPAQQAGPLFDGLVLDLGLSSAQLEDRSRGFSFKLVASPLEMAFGGEKAELSSLEIVNTWSEVELNKIIWEYGEERFARSIAKEIVKARKEKYIATVGDLLAVIEKAIPPSFLKKPGIHFATKTFQALRIATNDELGSLENALKASLEVLKKGSRIVIVSFHSLEDRIVKDFFRRESRECLCPPELPVCQCGHKRRVKILTKKVIEPSREEIQRNPRARSAKLRAVELI